MRVGLSATTRLGRAVPFWAIAVHLDLVEQEISCGLSPAYPEGEQDQHRQPASVDDEVNPVGQPGLGPSEGFPVDREGFDPFAGAAPFQAPAVCW